MSERGFINALQTPKFLEIADIFNIHQILIEQFGGMPGVRDEGLLESAVSQPQVTFFGELLHPTIQAQAAAYLYHLAKNHPFLDGNNNLWCNGNVSTLKRIQLNYI